MLTSDSRMGHNHTNQVSPRVLHMGLVLGYRVHFCIALYMLDLDLQLLRSL
jgi:hypothetical protein